MNLQALIIEDEKLVAWSLKKHLQKSSIEARVSKKGEEGIRAALASPPDLVFIDYRLPDITGIEVLQRLQSIRRQTIFFFMTAYGTTEIAVEALKLGAFEYLNKPINFDELSILTEKALEQRGLALERGLLKEREEELFSLGDFVCQSPKMQKNRRIIQKLIEADSGTILLLGETGTGKDLLARLIHENSSRSEKPFVIVNCTTLSSTLLESELFGHEKGAFTDAKTLKRGKVELADDGTIYLDEIGEIPIDFQAKFLRFIETRSFSRVGGTRELKVNVRLIASSNRNLNEERTKGNFREDLYHRLNVVAMTQPPLRDRREDIPPLVNRFINQFNTEFNLRVNGTSELALRLLCDYSWPGNIRELRNVIERIFLLEHPVMIEPHHLPSHLKAAEADSGTPAIDDRPGVTPAFDATEFFEGESLASIEKLMVQWALSKCKGNQTHAAGLLDISRDQLRYRLKKYRLL
jgi:DNA-binding NtrC family response regulator